MSKSKSTPKKVPTFEEMLEQKERKRGTKPVNEVQSGERYRQPPPPETEDVYGDLPTIQEYQEIISIVRSLNDEFDVGVKMGFEAPKKIGISFPPETDEEIVEQYIAKLEELVPDMMAPTTESFLEKLSDKLINESKTFERKTDSIKDRDEIKMLSRRIKKLRYVPKMEVENREICLKFPDAVSEKKFKSYARAIDDMVKGIRLLGTDGKEATYVLSEDYLQAKKTIRLARKIEKARKKGDVSEGLLSDAVGMLGGAIAGPKIGRAVANALGVEKGILYDFLTSRVAGAAIGKVVADFLGNQGFSIKQ